jgi:hypothetical protein
MRPEGGTMGAREKTDSVMLARNWNTERVIECLEGKQKFELIRFLDERYSERFFGPINCLRQAPDNEHGYGFAIMALCCLLVETIECYREGLPSSFKKDLIEMKDCALNHSCPPDYKLNGDLTGVNSGEVFKDFFERPEHRQYFPDVDYNLFYKKIRCGLLHQAQTKGSWRLIRTGKFWDANEESINRNEFAQRLKNCFDGYREELNNSEWDSKIWKLAGRKIWWLAKQPELEG